MTAPGDGFSVNPGDLHRHASQRRVEAADFLTDKPPPVPGDPDDPTVDATADLSGDVHGVNQHLHNKSNRTADKVDADGHAYSAEDQGGSGHIGKLTQGVDAQGFGAVMAPFFQLGGQFVSALGTMFGQATSATAGLGGQTLSAGANLLGQTAKNTGVGAAVAPGGGVGLGASGGGDKDNKGQTSPAAASSPLLPQQGGSPRGLHPGDYAHTETQDREEHIVQPAGGMPMGGGMAGMGAGGASSPTKPRMYKIHAPHDPPTEPIPVVTEVAYAPSPLKESHGTDT